MVEKATFSERLNLIIKEQNIRQKDLCQMTGIGKSAMSHYLHGSFEPKQQNLHTLAEALDVSEAWLMGYDVPKDRRALNSVSVAPNEKLSANAKDSGFFYFTAPDDSMVNAHIPDGSITLIQKQFTADSGQIVQVSSMGTGACLRYYYKQGDSILLLPANINYVPLVHKNADLTSGVLQINGILKQIIIDL